MDIGVLETGPVVEKLIAQHGTYGQMFERMLQRADTSFTCTPYRVYENAFPSGPNAHSGWIISGSKYGVYEDHNWIPPLENFIRQAVAQRVPVAGFCFGHQIMAQALGGRVEKSEKGWGLGVQDYPIQQAQHWMSDARTDFSSVAVHQDQVIDPPEGATVLASSTFCPHAMLAYGKAQAPHAISVQPHPEFDTDFVKDLIASRRGTVFENETADHATSTLSKPVDNDQWSHWVVNFFKSAAAA
jgi:GMP synthase-like glutamine amidotransferase